MTTSLPLPRPRPGSAASATDLRKSYGKGDTAVTALAGVTVSFDAGRFHAVMGPSGSGKSTLMHCLAGLDSADSGEVHVGDAALTGMNDKQLTALRRDRVGFVFQQFNLLPTLTAEENILLPARLNGRLAELRPRAEELMSGLGIAHLAARYPGQASLGEQQRCAVSRALLLSPTLLLADEPTAHQDAGWTDAMFTAFRDLLRHGGACLIATHNPETWGYADRVLSMKDGELREGAPDPVH